MGNIYVTCARCNKGMTIAEYNCVFCSDIDNQIVCSDCYKKEQPKELMKKIADLESKLAESEEIHKLLETQLKDMERSKLAWENKFFKLEKQLADITEKYNACQEARKLEGEFSQQDKKELIQQLAEKEKEIAKWKNKKIKHLVDGLLVDRNLAIQIVEEIREDFRQKSFCNDYHEYIVDMEIFEYFNNKIKSLKGDSQ